MWMPMAMLEVMLASSDLLWALVDGESMCTFIFVFLKQIESCALALYVHWHDSIYLIKAVLMGYSIISASATWYLLFDILMYILRLAFECHHRRLALVQFKDGATLWRGEDVLKSHVLSGEATLLRSLVSWLIPNRYPHPVDIY